MACHFSVLSAILLILILTATLGAFRSASSQGEGFQSINCGGEAYNDSDTKIIWEEDPFNKQNNEPLYGVVGKANSSLINTTHVMTSLRYFPNNMKNKKFCYQLKVSNGSTYVLRASFLYGNYDGINRPPSFVLIFNSVHWTNVTTFLATPIMHELTFVSKEHDLNICLARHLNLNHTPFISTLELRRLQTSMYIKGTAEGFPSAFSQGYGLMLWRRINYGAKTNAAIRYPDDIYDRIWEANTTGPIANMSTSKVSTFYGADAAEPPAAVMATAITTNDPKGNLSFTYEDFGGPGGFRIEMHFVDPFENASTGQPRDLRLAFPHSNLVLTQMAQAEQILVPASSPISLFLDQQSEFPKPLQITLFPADGSPRGPLLNAIELFRWTQHNLSTTGTFQGDVDAIQLIQTQFNLTGHGQGDPCIPDDNTWTWIACNKDTEPRITEIHLSSFNLTGHIPPSIENLTNLQKIDLSNNMLSGEIPDFNPLQDLDSLNLHNNRLQGPVPPLLPSLPKLVMLDLSNNNLCGSPLSFRTSTNYIFDGNLELCDSCLCNSHSSSDYSTRKYIYAISFLGALYIVSVLIFLVIYKARHSRKTLQDLTSTKATNIKGVDPFITKMFTYNDILNATLNFTTILGEGGFGKVYHGLLPTGEVIAVKMLADASRQGLKEFFNEVAILSRVRHKNLVSLIGYCVENTYMLIYEYIAKGNLRDLIYGDVESTDRPLPWKTRLHIALDASQGLEYLHMGCDPAIIHRDVKSSNILLSDKMQAKVADFGLSRLKEGDTTISHVSTANVVGTPGYLDPAYNATSQLTDKSDVYSFGIVLLELICGRAPIDMFTSPPHIVDWAKEAIMQGKIEDIVDPTLANGYKVESMRYVLNVAFGCVESDRIKRPKMIQVSQILQNALEIEMDQTSLPHPLDVSGSSSTSDGKLASLQYIESLRIKLDPR